MWCGLTIPEASYRVLHLCPNVVSFELPLPVAIFAGLSTWLALSGLVFLAGGLVGRLLQAVLS